MNTTTEVPWIELREEQGVTVLTFKVNRLNSKQHRREEYLQVLSDLIDARHDRIVLNFANLNYTNHAWGVFQLVISASNLITAAGGRMAVCQMKGHIRRVFQFANLGRFVPAYRTERRAVASLLSD